MLGSVLTTTVTSGYRETYLSQSSVIDNLKLLALSILPINNQNKKQSETIIFDKIIDKTTDIYCK